MEQAAKEGQPGAVLGHTVVPLAMTLPMLSGALRPGEEAPVRVPGLKPGEPTPLAPERILGGPNSNRITSPEAESLRQRIAAKSQEIYHAQRTNRPTEQLMSEHADLSNRLADLQKSNTNPATPETAADRRFRDTHYELNRAAELLNSLPEGRETMAAKATIQKLIEQGDTAVTKGPVERQAFVNAMNKATKGGTAFDLLPGGNTGKPSLHRFGDEGFLGPQDLKGVDAIRNIVSGSVVDAKVNEGNINKLKQSYEEWKRDVSASTPESLGKGQRIPIENHDWLRNNAPEGAVAVMMGQDTGKPIYVDTDGNNMGKYVPPQWIGTNEAHAIPPDIAKFAPKGAFRIVLDDTGRPHFIDSQKGDLGKVDHFRPIPTDLRTPTPAEVDKAVKIGNINYHEMPGSLVNKFAPGQVIAGLDAKNNQFHVWIKAKEQSKIVTKPNNPTYEEMAEVRRAAGAGRNLVGHGAQLGVVNGKWVYSDGTPVPAGFTPPGGMPTEEYIPQYKLGNATEVPINYRGEKIGSIAVKGNGIAEVDFSYLVPEKRGNGYGALAYLKTFEEMRKQGINIVQSDSGGLSVAAQRVWEGLRKANPGAVQRIASTNDVPRYQVDLRRVGSKQLGPRPNLTKKIGE